MSQPLEFGPNQSDPLQVPIKNIDDLVALFANCEKKNSPKLLGIEYEIFSADKNFQPLAYEGDTSISNYFLYLAKKFAGTNNSFTPIFEDKNVVALNHEHATIALEPGGQIEIAAKPHADLLLGIELFEGVVEQLAQAAKDLEISLFATGLHPRAAREQMAKVKKRRYTIMRQYMSGLEGLGLDMMTRSCAIQVNLDFSSEQDMIEKFRLACGLSPIFALIMSTSGFFEGQKTQSETLRSYIWKKTDPDRTGFPPLIFSKDFGYESYVDHILNVPMYFIRRGHNYIDVAGNSFRQFINEGYKDCSATVRDFHDHLSTVFTEVRLKPFLEIRSPDSAPLFLTKAFMVLCHALFYEKHSFENCRNLFSDLTHKEVLQLQNDIFAQGFKTNFRGQSLGKLLNQILFFARDGIEQSNNFSNGHKKILQNFLQPLEKISQHEKNFSMEIKNNFSNMHDENFSRLIKSFHPFSENNFGNFL